jgi:hypothetical protein
MASHRPKAPKVVVSHGKVCEGPIRPERKEARASEVMKAVERDTAWS